MEIAAGWKFERALQKIFFMRSSEEENYKYFTDEIFSSWKSVYLLSSEGDT